MAITKEDVQHIAQLARVGLEEQEIERFSKDLNAVLKWVEKLNELNTDDVEPMAHVGGVKNRLRSDKVEEFGGEGIEKIKENFPDRSGEFDKVNKVL